MRSPRALKRQGAEGDTDAGQATIVSNYMVQPWARPQGVPVGPQSTCHALDRGASTLWIPLPLGLKP